MALKICHTNAFSKVTVFISEKTKQNIFIHTSGSVFVSVSPIHAKTLKKIGTVVRGMYQHHKTIRHLKSACDAFYVIVFTLNEAFSKRCVFKSLHFCLKVESKVSVFIGVFGRFSVDDTRKHFKKYGFSNKKRIIVDLDDSV